jgi:thiamine-phosphate pyrophosphorylase
MTKIYLISPEKFEVRNFAKKLESVLVTGLVPAFQLRLKGYEISDQINIAKEIKKVCHSHGCLFLVNDSFDVAAEVVADGVHIGADDGSVANIRKKSPKNFVIGASCYDSKHLASIAAEEGADYISFGAFFPSKTKKSRGNPRPEIITWAKDLMNLPVVTIGGINLENCNLMKDAGADFVSVISYIWDQEGREKQAVIDMSSKLK